MHAGSPATMLSPQARKAVVDRLLAERAQRGGAPSAAVPSPERAALIETLVQQHTQRTRSSPGDSPTLRLDPVAELPAGTLVSPPSSAGGSCRDLGGSAHARVRPVHTAPPKTQSVRSAPRDARTDGSEGVSDAQPTLRFVPLQASGPQEVDSALLDSGSPSPRETRSRSHSPVARSVASSATRSLNFASDLLPQDRRGACRQQPLAATDLVRRDSNASPEVRFMAPDAAQDRRQRLQALRSNARGGARGKVLSGVTQRGGASGQHLAALLDGIQQKQVSSGSGSCKLSRSTLLPRQSSPPCLSVYVCLPASADAERICRLGSAATAATSAGAAHTAQQPRVGAV